MNSNKRILVILLLCLLCAAVMSACGTEEPEETEAVTTEFTSAATSAATTEYTSAATTTEPSETEAVTAATSEDIPVLLTPESLWDGAEELCLGAIQNMIPNPALEKVTLWRAEYYVTDPTTVSAVKAWLSQPELTPTDSNDFARTSPNVFVGADGMNKFQLIRSTYDGVSSVYERTYIFSRGEKSNIYLISEAGRAGLEELFEKVTVKNIAQISSEPCFDGWSGEHTSGGVTVFLTHSALEGYSAEGVTRVMLIYDLSDSGAVEALISCFENGAVSDKTWDGAGSNISFELPDGRVIRGTVEFADNGRVLPCGLFLSEKDGNTVVIEPDPAGLDVLADILSDFVITGAEN